MKVERVIVGSLEENCYVISNDNDCLVIDPGDQFNKIKEVIGNKNVLGVLITHYHFDHIGALEELITEYKTGIYDFRKEEKEYCVGPFTFEIINTPGHTTDSISFYFKEINSMFVGDFVFFRSIGRCDLEGGDINTMKKSINKLKCYKEDIILYPGHGSDTTLNYEKLNNSYF